MDQRVPLGVTLDGPEHARALVWAPRARRVTLVLEDGAGGASGSEMRMEALGDGYFGAEWAGAHAGLLYRFRLDDGPSLPDPASRSQPKGIHGPSEVIQPAAFPWSATGWRGIARRDLVLYEIHVGTFTDEGTFDAAQIWIPRLAELGVTAVEIMPVAAFPGERNWGYDGVFPYAVQTSYGGMEGLQRLVDALHRAGLAAVLDVVYNHVGPEGNILTEYGPYFTDAYRTPWGSAVNFSDAESDHVRRFFLESARYLVETARLDGLRVDAVHAIVDPTARPFLAELTDDLHGFAAQRGVPLHLLAESAANDPAVVAPTESGGLGFDAIWNDDFHHALHARLTGERRGYYVDYGELADIAQALGEGFVLGGRYSAFYRRRHGRSSRDLASDRMIVFAQNHDQVGNRARGDRLSTLLPFEALKLAAGTVLLSPYLPLLFMGEEYGETAPFLFFTSHTEPAIIEAVRKGRRSEFPDEPGSDVPDPQDPASFARSKARGDRGTASDRGRTLWAFYQRLLALRRRFGLPGRGGIDRVRAGPDGGPLLSCLAGPAGGGTFWMLSNFAAASSSLQPETAPFTGSAVLVSSDERWAGPGRGCSDAVREGEPVQGQLGPFAFVVYARAPEG
jgi:maltooligosyltrehalose trehalohydrolase